MAAIACCCARVLAQAPLVDLLSNPPEQLAAPADAFVAEHVRVEVAPRRERAFAGEPLEIAVRVWLERDFVERHLQQLSARRLDLPVQVLCPWLERDVVAGSAVSGGATLALGDRAAAAQRLPEREFEQRVWRGVELRARLAPAGAGELRLEPPRLRLVYATEFRATLLDEREATDSRVAGVVGPALALRVEALPELGRPFDFGGAIGRFELSASVDRTELAVGETFRLEVLISGDGNLGEFDPPRLPPSTDYRVVGQLARREDDQLVVTYDLSALSRRLVQTPTVTLPFFDPSELGGYRSISASPIPLRVRPGASSDPAAPPTPGAHGIAGRASLFALAALCVGAVLAVAVVLWRLFRGRARTSQ